MAFTFPFSFIFSLFVFVLGAGISAVLFGLLAFAIFIACAYLGVIRITPLFNLMTSVMKFFWPEKVDRIAESIRKSFVLEYPDGKPAKESQIFLFHPHGAFTVAYFLNIGTKFMDWQSRPIKGAALHLLLNLPFAQEFFDTLHFVPSSYDAMSTVLKDGESLGVCLGGAREVLYTEAGRMRLSIARKRGVFRMAIEQGCGLVPVLTYGENELYELNTSPWLTWLNSKCVQYGFSLPIPTWESCERWFGILENPLAVPVRTVVGAAVRSAAKAGPSDADISELRERYFVALRDLYARTRPSTYAETLEIV